MSILQGAIGKATNYVDLTFNSAKGLYQSDDGPNYPTTEKLGGYVSVTAGGGHPGDSGGNNGKWDTYAIHAFVISRAGLYTLHRTTLDLGAADGDGSDVRVYVNDVLMNDVEVVGHAQVAANSPILKGGFDTILGELKSGDAVYVCVGPRFAASYDSYGIDFTISLGRQW